MKDAVLAIFVEFNTRFDGALNWMYLNKKGLLTVGWGFVIEPVTVALRLPWICRADAGPPSQDEIWRNCKRVKENRLLAHRGPGAARLLTNVDLAPEGMLALAKERLDANERSFVEGCFPDFGSWPADAQLAVHSMAWVFPAFCPVFPKFVQAAKEQAWASCSAECRINDKHNPAIMPRNFANAKLFNSAATTREPDQVSGWP